MPANAGTYAERLYLYIIILFYREQGCVQKIFLSRPQYGFLETGISRSNHFVRVPSSGAGCNAPRPALSAPHLDVNADGG